MQTEKKKVDYRRPEVTRLTPSWQLVRDCVAGEIAVKAGKDKYLPRPNPTDKSAANKTRFEQYLARAIFYGVTGRTLHGLSGMVFSEPPAMEYDTTLEPLVANADGFGETLAQQSKVALETVLSLGRAGLLVDFPKRDAPTTRAELASGEVQPIIKLYQPEQIINWRTSGTGGKRHLTLLVLEETSEVPEADGFGLETVKKWRVFRRAEVNGATVVTAEVWERKDQQHEPAQIEPPAVVADHNGRPFDAVPFVFLGVSGNTEVPEDPPLYDLATINLGHYRNSADLEEACFLVGQPTPFVTGVTETWAKNILKGEIQIGSRAIIPLPSGGSAGLLQASPNQLLKEAMDTKQQQMIALGARLVQEKAVQRTATEAGMERQTEVSVLASVAINVAAGYTLALDYAGRYVGATKKPLMELNTEFATSTMPTADRAQLLVEYQGGLVTFDEARDNLRAAGVVWEDNVAAKDKIDSASLASMEAEAAIAATATPPAAKE
jgi:hypothetical protein